MMTTDLAAWLIDRIAEDEEVARVATPGRWKLWGMSVMADQDGTSSVDTAVGVAHTSMRIDGKPRTFDAAHIARWDPARVLAECQAKRRIVKAYEFETDTPPDGTDQPPAMALRLLAQPYSDRDGYDPAWAVE